MDGIEPCASIEATIAGADLVILAAPPLACLELLDELAGPARPSLADALITDVASTKVQIVERADAHGLRFVGGHPMAGREARGYASADASLFRDRPWIVVRGRSSSDDDVDRVVALADACGARASRMDAAEHDVAVALISHAPLVVSAALVEAATGRSEWPRARGLAAGGWAGMTRLALGDPEMGGGILATNRAATADALGAVRSAIDEWIDLLSRDDSAAELRSRLDHARSGAALP
jgi:prephenate dehydrogenase